MKHVDRLNKIKPTMSMGKPPMKPSNFKVDAKRELQKLCKFKKSGENTKALLVKAAPKDYKQINF